MDKNLNQKLEEIASTIIYRIDPEAKLSIVENQDQIVINIESKKPALLISISRWIRIKAARPANYNRSSPVAAPDLKYPKLSARYPPKCLLLFSHFVLRDFFYIAAPLK